MAHILTLDDYCLEIIFQQLNIYGQVQLAQVSERFLHIFKRFAKRRYRKIRGPQLEKLPLIDRVVFFQLVGEHIREYYEPLNGESYMLQLISDHCTGIEALELNIEVHWPDHYFDYLRKMKTLETIVLYAYETCGIEIDRLMPTITELPNIKCFIINADFYKGKYLSRMKGIEVLQAMNNSMFCTDYILECIESMPQLRVLCLGNHCEYLIPEAFQKLLENCPNLQELTIKNCRSTYEMAAHFPKLNYLSIKNRSIRNELFVALAAKKAHQLEYLAIDEYQIEMKDAELISQLAALKSLTCRSNNDACFKYFTKLGNLQVANFQGSNVSPATLIDILCECKRLRIVNINGCRLMNTYFVFDAYARLRRNFSRRNTIHIYADPRSIYKFAIEQSDDFEEMRKIIRVRFDNIDPKLICNDPYILKNSF